MTSIESKANASISDGFRRACSYFPTGVAIVDTTGSAYEPVRFTVSSFAAVSYQPPLISICVSAGSRNLAPLLRSPDFSVAILREDQEKSARGCSTPVSDGAVAHLVCEVKESVAAGDHVVVIAAVRDIFVRGGNPLVYWRRAFFSLHFEYPFVATGTALDDFVRDWEAGALPHSAWTHSAHVAVSAYYAFDCDTEELFAAMKRGIIHFNTCVGTINGPDSGYHETLTRFWSGVIADFTRQYDFRSRIDAAREAVAVFGEDRDLHRMYYSFDVVRDRRARREWVRPDRRPPAGWCGQRTIREETDD